MSLLKTDNRINRKRRFRVLIKRKKTLKPWIGLIKTIATLFGFRSIDEINAQTNPILEDVDKSNYLENVKKLKNP